jgi:hypothetical protein
MGKSLYRMFAPDEGSELLGESIELFDRWVIPRGMIDRENNSILI